MKKLLSMGLITASLVSMESYAAIDIGMRTPIAISSLSSLQSEDDYIYINMAEAESANFTKMPYAEKITSSWLNKTVLLQGKNVLLDYTDSTPDDIRKYSLLRDTFGISLNRKLVVISKHKGKLMLTPMTQDEIINSQVLQKVLTPPEVPLVNTSNEDYSSKVGDNNELTLPHVAFYIQELRSIQREECTFPQAARKTSLPIHLCSDNANISLIYRVTLARSLKYGALGAETPDSKIVRVSLDDSSSGSGIHLNDNFTGWNSWSNPAGMLTGWRKMFVTDAIAQNYIISVKANNQKASILSAFPVNINPNIEKREIKTVEFGVTGGVEADSKGPKAKLEASANYTDQRWLTFNTQEYRIARSTPTNREVKFKWEREAFSTANSLLTWSSGTVWQVNNPVNHSRVSPISYRNFVPAMDTVYRASPTETGTTTFELGTSITLRPIYTGIYQYYYLVGGHNETRGFEMPEYWKSVNNSASFTVDWEHPVFTGGRTVNLQVGAVNSRCVSVDKARNVFLDKCSEFSNEQSFIYDQYGRYVSATNTNLCLDGDNLNQLQACNVNLSQRWVWLDNSDNLTNTLSGETLGYSPNNGMLQLYHAQGDSINLRMLTNFTNVYSSDTIDKLDGLIGYNEGDSKKLNFQSNSLYLRSGWIIDAIGTESTNLFGGSGGDLHSVDLSKVKTMTAYHGKFGGQNRILYIEFIMKDKTIMSFGRKPAMTDVQGINTFNLDNGARPYLVAWKYNGCLSGFSFAL